MSKRPERTPVEPAGPDGGISVAPSLQPAAHAARIPVPSRTFDLRAAAICGVSVLLGLLATGVAQVLVRLINLFTNLAFHGSLSAAGAVPDVTRFGPWTALVPVAGGLVVGLLARYGSEAIRGHGIPEAMEKVLTSESRVPLRLTFLKPLSAAIAIGTGGPFGAEGPIIATGGALGSAFGQVLHVSAQERKTLLAAGAAAGMSAIFGTPISAVLLAVELLLFELRPRSIVAVALAAATAAWARTAAAGTAPFFSLAHLSPPTGGALAAYALLGIALGIAAVGASRLVLAVEDGFERLVPLPWMWWPALAGIAVGWTGLLEPRTLGVGYGNIDALLSGHLAAGALVALALLKLASWSVALGSGTSGGTLAPLFTIGGGLGALAGVAVASSFPRLGVDPHVAALVGMAGLFAGASHAFLASVVFAFEGTREPLALLPLLLGCAASYLVALLLRRTSIMTDKLERRGVRVVLEYTADFLARVAVREQMQRQVISLPADQSLDETRAWLEADGPERRHQGFPVVGEDGRLLGVVTRRDLFGPGRAGTLRVRDLIARPPAVVFEDSSLREAADHMVHENVGRLPVVRRDDPARMVGFITRGDILAAHERRLRETRIVPGAFASSRWRRP